MLFFVFLFFLMAIIVTTGVSGRLYLQVLYQGVQHLFDIWQKISYRRIADEQTLLKIRLPDVNIPSNRLASIPVGQLGVPCSPNWTLSFIILQILFIL